MAKTPAGFADYRAARQRARRQAANNLIDTVLNFQQLNRELRTKDDLLDGRMFGIADLKEAIESYELGWKWEAEEARRGR